MARILIIDDEELARFTIREILEPQGHDISEASNGNEGIALQKAQPFDLIITDMIMPEKEGIETIADLTRDYPNIKIIGVSGSGRQHTRDMLSVAVQFGAEQVLAKPFTADELLSCVDACLSEPE